MRGTENFISECEANNTWKKNGSTWWNAKEARFMEESYQKIDNSIRAWINFNNSPVLGNILSGGNTIEIVGDKYMGEAILILKGSDSSLGQTLDRMKDNKFKQSFFDAYKKAEKDTNPRKEIYTSYGNRITWTIE